MKQGVILCGCNGSGKTTLGRMLAQELGWTFIDIEECFFPNANPDDPYNQPNTRQEAARLLLNRARCCENFVLAAVKGNYGEEITSLYTLAVWLRADPKTRTGRIQERSLRQFGERALPGGDLYEREQAFLTFAAGRDEQEVAEWLDSLSCPVIQLDGGKPLKENLDRLLKILSHPESIL